jgi:hypothetical protein
MHTIERMYLNCLKATNLYIIYYIQLFYMVYENATDVFIHNASMSCLNILKYP